MGKNTGNGGRIGLVKGRRQAFNPKTKKYIKINTDTGKIMKTSYTKFKGVRMVNRIKKFPSPENHPNIKKTKSGDISVGQRDSAKAKKSPKRAKRKAPRRTAKRITREN